MSVAITPERLDSLFRPRSVALVGAADKSMFSAIAYSNLAQSPIADSTYLVNRRGVETHGMPTITSCAELDGSVDVAYLMVPQSGTLAALEDAAGAGIRNAVILSSGYAEAGDAGRAAEAELVETARKLDMLILGPNHLGFANFAQQLPVLSMPGLPKESGAVGLLSQSGASSGAMLDYAKQSGVGLSYLVTLGNEAMITAGHVLDFLVDDPATKAIAIFLESIRDPEQFARAARRAAAAGKAVVVLKAGSSELAARTAAAHTGALVGDDRVVDAVLRELGVIRVDSIEDMLVTAGAAAEIGRLQRPGIGIVSISGGACDIIADRADDLGMSLPEFSAVTEKALAAKMPAYGSVHNPFDITGAAVIDPSMFTNAIEAIGSDESIGAVLVVNGLPVVDSPIVPMQMPMLEAIGAGAGASTVPTVLVNQVAQPITPFTREVMAKASIPSAISGLKQAVQTMEHLAWWSQRVGDVVAPADIELPSVSTTKARSGKWSENDARDLLEFAGVSTVPSALVSTATAAVTAAASFGGKVAMKIVSPDILHKSDVGGVMLGVEGADSVAAAFDNVSAAAAKVPDARVDGVLVSPMRGPGIELLVGVVRDEQWGPILAVALGGVYVEVLKDSALATLPVSPTKAKDMLLSLRGVALLQGARGAVPADLDAVAVQIAKVGDLALALGDDLISLEVNPLRVDGAEVEALDAAVEWRE
ncbi:MAG: CoA-binding protein [Gordonia sp.]|nr:CoA-binding protein [Gordonia sp. (in: high G+C Gram-positive bacteria)]